MVSGGEENASTFEFTPTWILGSVCAVIVLFFLLFEKALEFATKALNKMAKNGTRFEALKKVKEELMLVGFISLLLSVFQGPIQKICIPESLTQHGLPCKRYSPSVSHIVSVAHFSTDLPLHFTSSKSTRELLASESSSHCKDGRVPLLSLEAVHQLHIFLFVLAITHLVLSFATIALGTSMMEKWNHLEAEVRQRDDDRNTYAIIRTKDRVPVSIKDPSFKWLRSLFRQFYAPVTLSDYLVIRLGFVMAHTRGNLQFFYYNYLMRSLQDDFKKILSIRWYHWVFVIIFLMLNVSGWHAYFWISFTPLILLLVVGGKLERIKDELIRNIAEKYTSDTRDLVIISFDEYFWFYRPNLILFLIHFIFFQNAFQIAYFFWMLTTYGFHSCILEQPGYIVTQLFISVIVQIICSYSTLPLYAIIFNTGSQFKRHVFDENVQEMLMNWLKRARKKPSKKISTTDTAGNESESEVQREPEAELQDIKQEAEIEEVNPTNKVRNVLEMV